MLRLKFKEVLVIHWRLVMIKKMRLKFIAITIISLMVLLASVLLSINYFVKMNHEESLERLINEITFRDGDISGTPPRNNTPPPKKKIGYFSVKLDEDENIIEIINKISYDETIEPQALTEQVMNSNKSSGSFDSLRYQMVEKNYGYLLVFVDQSIEDQFLVDLKETSFKIGFLSFFTISLLSIYISKFITKPIEVAFKKQKRFISDSSHQLKTPLTIMSANMDLLMDEVEENPYLTEIKKQYHRMHQLINSLMTLANTQALEQEMPKTAIDLSQLVENTVLPFEVLAYENNKNLVLEIEENIQLKCIKEKIVEMIEALVDNAIKYAKDNSEISIKLNRQNNGVHLSISNYSEHLTELEKEKIFETFYRIDDTRYDTPGHGLGLCIAKNIVEAHGGKMKIHISAKQLVTFEIIF